ncbi:Cytochrome c biogenesis protein CcsA [Austwickia sp. TVS 96-490-7B]|uniref:c-type cytochrome biogenesis protein CcsB n=1 Tax=Austwickia sp. TVS 96-490-7B TaxID=2830843 RepID=UPI001C58A45D|nr:c-type cytochrome biogenesis protein CcsB [Austwickia sp. TVS 96-490-7B]MBW3084820.1 Cytochrome c biogenesis protein CcsA [Austwickia sp. TVS 96-490-7B]
MLDISQYFLVAATVLVALALAADVAAVALRRATSPALVPVGAAGPDSAGGDAAAGASSSGDGAAWLGSALGQVSLICLTASLWTRAAATGHGPFANQHEFAVSFAWGILAVYVYFEWRYRIRALALLVLPVTIAMLMYAQAIDSDAQPLVPALQNNFLLTVHVATAVLSYGAAGVAFGAAALYLLKPYVSWKAVPAAAVLDELGYRAAVVSYPLMTVMIILGAVWAEIAWGTYWSWDPKETAALVTWLIYGAYLHARVVRDWRGRRAAWLLILGFAAVLFTYFGNLFFGGLHSYA